MAIFFFQQYAGRVDITEIVVVDADFFRDLHRKRFRPGYDTGDKIKPVVAPAYEGNGVARADPVVLSKKIEIDRIKTVRFRLILHINF